jgi:hypothetical protein
MQRFLKSFFFILISCLLQKKGFKNGASQQMFGPSYFDRASEGLHHTLLILKLAKTRREP